MCCCPRCFSNNIIKNGHTYYGKQNYFCKKCNRNFIIDTNRKTLSEENLGAIERALIERNSLRGICRIFEVSLSWLLLFAAKVYKNLPDDLNLDLSKIISDEFSLELILFEADELWSFVRRKSNKKWVWLIMDRESRQIIAFHVGGRTKRDARKLWKNIPDIARSRCFVYTDFLQSYKEVIPKNQHQAVGKETGQTSHIERVNGTFRQRLSRLVRKTLSFSKDIKNHLGAIKHFICSYNKSLNMPLL